MKALTFQTDGGGKLTASEVPPDLAETAKTARDALIEMVAEADDTLMEKFFEAGTLTEEELGSGLREATLGRRVFPLLCTSALLNLGIQPLLDAVVRYAPSPLEHSLKAIARSSGEPTSYESSDTVPPASFVWENDSPTPSPDASPCFASPWAHSGPTPPPTT